jgi:hypothetical protein
MPRRAFISYPCDFPRLRWNPQPRIFGLWLGAPRLVATHDANVEALSAETYPHLLEDLPPEESVRPVARL